MAWSPKIASSSFWPTTAVPPAMPISAPVSPAVEAKTTISASMIAQPVEPEGQHPRCVPLVLALGTDQVEHGALPRTDLLRRGRPQTRTAPGQVVGTEQALTGRVGPPRGVGTFGRPVGLVDDQRVQAVLDRLLDPCCRLWAAPDEGCDPVAQYTDLVLQRAEELTGADEVLPAGEHLATEEAAVPRGSVDCVGRVRVGDFGSRSQALGGPVLVVRRLGQRWRAAHDPGHGTVERAPHDLARAPASDPRSCSQVETGTTCPGGSMPSSSTFVSPTTNSGAAPRPC